MVPDWQLPDPIAGSNTRWLEAGAGMGSNAQSEPQVCATGKRVTRPTSYWRISDASRALTKPLPVTSQAMCCAAVSPRAPAADCSAYTASRAEIPVPASPSFWGAICQVPALTSVKAYAPLASVSVVAGVEPVITTVALRTAAPLL